MTLATAPGKLVLYGEYAVLEGAPAAAASVDVRARARVDVTGGLDSVFIDLAGGKAYNFAVDPADGLAWNGDAPGPRGTIVTAVLDTCHELAHLRGPMPPLRISLNTDAFFTRVGDVTEKLGLGSSAAALVALTGALIDALGIPIETDSLLNICRAAHLRLQGGRGSGIDVTAALLGGVVGVRSGPRESQPTVDSLAWPDGLLVKPVWSGNGASTPALLERFAAYRAHDEDGFVHHLRRLTHCARHADAAWRSAEVTQILSALAGYDDALRALDYDAQIGINTAGHERLRGLTESHGAVYKTSGAGGGDFGLVLTDSADVLGDVEADMRDTESMVLDRTLAVDGLSICREATGVD